MRRLAIECFDEGDETLAALALKDPDAAVRTAALGRDGAPLPDILRSTLHDPDETVRAVALEARAGMPEGEDQPDLVANVEA